MYNYRIYEILKEGNNLKKTLYLLLALLFTLLFTTAVFAANEEIDDPMLPTSPDTVTDSQYEEITEFEEGEVPQSVPIIDVVDEKVPEALPQTGGIPAEAFYIVGGICILSAILLLTRKSKSSAK